MAHRGVSVKTLKRMLKKKGLKTSGRKAALTRRAKKAGLVKGGFFFGMPSGKTKQNCSAPNPYGPPAMTCREQCLPNETPGSPC